MKIIDPRALGNDVQVGNFCTIGPDVEIGAGTRIGNNVTIHAGTKIGSGVRIDDNAVVGKVPMRAATSANPLATDLPPTQIGNGCILGTGVVLYRGCQIDDECLVADLATIREHVVVGRKTIVGRNVAMKTTAGKLLQAGDQRLYYCLVGIRGSCLRGSRSGYQQ